MRSSSRARRARSCRRKRMWRRARRRSRRKPNPPKAEPPKAAVPAPEPKAAEPPKAAAPAVAEAPKAAAPAKAPAPKADVAKTPPKSETSFIDDFPGGKPGLVIGGGALAALAGLLLIVARRRKTVKFEDSIIGGTDIKSNTVFGSTGGGVVNTGENSLATDFSREGLGNIDTDEVDPIAEAEVYLAYGRDAQAEEILKDALKKDSQRQEIYLKLLEIHAQHNKPSAFETVAAELYSVSQGKGETWQKAVTLGRQLDPNNPMFGEGGAEAAAAAAAAAAGKALAGGAAHAAPSAKPRDEARGGGGTSPAIAQELAGDSALDFRFDEDVSISRTGNTTKAQIDMINAAEREFEESAKTLVPPAAQAAGSQGSAAKAAAVVAAVAAAAKGMAPTESAPAAASPLARSRLPPRRRRPSRGAGPVGGESRQGCRGRACARPAAGRDRRRQARSRFRSRPSDVRRPDAVRAGRAVARCRDQARSRQGVPGNGRCRRRSRNPAGSAARRRRHPEVRGAGTPGEARLRTNGPHATAVGGDRVVGAALAALDRWAYASARRARASARPRS